LRRKLWDLAVFAVRNRQDNFETAQHGLNLAQSFPFIFILSSCSAVIFEYKSSDVLLKKIIVNMEEHMRNEQYDGFHCNPRV